MGQELRVEKENKWNHTLGFGFAFWGGSRHFQLPVEMANKSSADKQLKSLHLDSGSLQGFSSQLPVSREVCSPKD